MQWFLVGAMVRGYHIYKDIWVAVVGEEFPCKCEDGNRVDPFAVAVSPLPRVRIACSKFDVSKILHIKLS